MTTQPLSTTSYALLGQLALRPWTGYEMTQNVRRTLHWFWPRAESVLYDELKRLADAGLAETAVGDGLRGRPRTSYSITPAGLSALDEWLRSAPPERSTLHSEALLRVHLAPYGTRDDLVATLTAAEAEGEALLRQALEIGTEFAAGTHQFQAQVHVRALLFDYLWSYGLGLFSWAQRSLAEVETWPSIEPLDAMLERGRSAIAALMDQESALVSVTSESRMSGQAR